MELKENLSIEDLAAYAASLEDNIKKWESKLEGINMDDDSKEINTEELFSKDEINEMFSVYDNLMEKINKLNKDYENMS